MTTFRTIPNKMTAADWQALSKEIDEDERMFGGKKARKSTDEYSKHVAIEGDHRRFV
jgi:hypothetical protein